MVTIFETSTMITDYVLATVCFVLAWRLRAVAERRSLPTAMWALALATAGVAAFLGGSFHGFFDGMSSATARVIWTLTLLSIGTTSFAIGVGAAASELRPAMVRPLFWLLVFKLATFAMMVIARPLFLTAVIDYASLAVAVGLLAAVSYRRHRRDTARWLLWAVLISFGAAVFLAVPFGAQGVFDERDVYHLVQIGAMVALYRAGRAASQTQL